MGRWLSRLEKTENGQIPRPQNHQNPTFESFEGSQAAPIVKKINAQDFINDCIQGLPLSYRETLGYFENDIAEIESGKISKSAFKLALNSWITASKGIHRQSIDEYDNRVNCSQCQYWNWRKQYGFNHKYKGGKSLLIRRCDQYKKSRAKQ